MGLDMYLNKVTYIGANYKHRKVEGNVDIKIDGEKVKINFNRISEIEEQIGCWRKANAIHKWFVGNCQGGIDDCRRGHVGKDKLKELLEVCKEVMNHKDMAEQLLPTQGGFFFGLTDIDEYYFGDIEKTINILTEALEESDLNVSFYYSSSW